MVLNAPYFSYRAPHPNISSMPLSPVVEHGNLTLVIHAPHQNLGTSECIEIPLYAHKNPHSVSITTQNSWKSWEGIPYLRQIGRGIILLKWDGSRGKIPWPCVFKRVFWTGRVIARKTIWSFHANSKEYTSFCTRWYAITYEAVQRVTLKTARASEGKAKITDHSQKVTRTWNLT